MFLGALRLPWVQLHKKYWIKLPMEFWDRQRMMMSCSKKKVTIARHPSFSNEIASITS